VTIRVLLVDDERLLRTGFSMILRSEPDLAVVGEAADGHEAVAAAIDLHPDVILMDIRMPGMDGLEATRRIVASGSSARILVLTTFDLDTYVYAALAAGASGFLLKDTPEDQLIGAIRAISAGHGLFAPSVTRRLIQHFAVQDPAPTATAVLDVLTSREQEILKLLAGALSNAEIARLLFISEHTVRTHVARILSKLQLHDRAQAIVVAYETGLVRAGNATRASRGGDTSDAPGGSVPAQDE
jgi:DNA-binding NarL/FixJ family response regulator